MNFEINAKDVNRIARNSASASVKEAASWYHFIKYRYGERFYGFFVDDIAFLFGGFCKSHFRLAEIAVEKASQGMGYGSFMMSILFEECAKRGIHEITLRTSKSENAHLWHRELGAEYVGAKDNDYEMRFII